MSRPNQEGDDRIYQRLQLLNTRHTIRVLEESALAYNNAIVELLNRFGITP